MSDLKNNTPPIKVENPIVQVTNNPIVNPAQHDRVDKKMLPIKKAIIAEAPITGKVCFKLKNISSIIVNSVALFIYL